MKMNRKQLFAALCIVCMALFSGCQSDKPADTFTTQYFTAEDSCEYAVIKLGFDYPTNGPQALVDSVLFYFQCSFSHVYEGDASDGQAFADYQLNGVKEELRAEWEEQRESFTEDGDAESEPWFMSIPNERTDIFTLVWHDDTFFTYDNDYYFYNSGAAHGIGGCVGTTFFREDGTRVKWSDFVKTASSDFQSILREGLRCYFGIDTEQELEGMLLLDDEVYTINHLPLPMTDPCVREDGIELHYTSYEIAPYAAGTPTFIVPISVMRPYLGERLQKAFANHDDSAAPKHIHAVNGVF